MRALTTPSRVKRVHVSSSDTVAGEGSGAAAVVSAFAVPRSPATVRRPQSTVCRAPGRRTIRQFREHFPWVGRAVTFHILSWSVVRQLDGRKLKCWRAHFYFSSFKPAQWLLTQVKEIFSNCVQTKQGIHSSSFRQTMAQKCGIT